MNFFERQEAARRGSRRLIWLFTLAVIVIVSLVTLAVAAVLIGGDSKALAQSGVLNQLSANAGLLIVVAVATTALIGISSLVRMSSLSEGGSAVARSLGGVPVGQDTTDLQLRRLRNVVEEIAIASGVPVPAIYVLEQEAGINAFAAGYSPNDAAVAVTRGALERLNRAELQGVIAHEFSHVLNGDMRLNIRLMGVLFGILVISIVGRKVLLHTRGGRDSKGVAAILLIALSLVLIGYAGLFFGRLIKAGVSRQREYLADASAVQFTRQTEGLAGALKKIAGVAEGSKLAAADGEEISHMLFGDGIGLSSMMATHPPLIDRIKALEPSFNAKAMAEIKTRYRNSPPSGLEEDRIMGLDGSHSTPTLGPVGEESGIKPGGVSEQVAHPASDDYLRAGVLHDALPELLKVAARSIDGAVPLVTALLLDSSSAQRDAQRAIVTAQLGASVGERMDELYAVVADLHPSLGLPLAALAFPALRRRPRADLERFVVCCDALIHVDGKVGLFEYSLARLLRSQVIDSLDPSRARGIGRRKLSASTQALADLFAVLAHQGHQDATQARQAYSAGLATILPQEPFTYAPRADWVRALDSALATLDDLEPRGKQLLVEGLVTTIGHDGQMTVAEAELLRTICGVVHCPLPPVLDR